MKGLSIRARVNGNSSAMAILVVKLQRKGIGISKQDRLSSSGLVCVEIVFSFIESY